MDFVEYLTSKKIDSKAFQENDVASWNEWNQMFELLHPNSFTQQKLFLINEIRRKYPLQIADVTETAIQKSAVKPKIKPAISGASKPKVAAKPKVGVKPQIKPKVKPVMKDGVKKDSGDTSEVKSKPIMKPKIPVKPKMKPVIKKTTDTKESEEQKANKPVIKPRPVIKKRPKTD